MQPIAIHKPSKLCCKFIGLFIGLAICMHIAIAPNIKFETENTIIPAASTDHDESTAMASKIFQFFSYETKPMMKFYFETSTRNMWMTAIPSIFFAISIVELSSSSQWSELGFNFGTNWRFIIICSWWILQLSVYLMKSIRELFKILIIFYVKQFQWNWTGLVVLFILIYLKLNVGIIMFRIINVAKNRIKQM